MQSYDCFEVQAVSMVWTESVNYSAECKEDIEAPQHSVGGDFRCRWTSSFLGLCEICSQAQQANYFKLATSATSVTQEATALVTRGTFPSLLFPATPVYTRRAGCLSVVRWHLNTIWPQEAGAFTPPTSSSISSKEHVTNGSLWLTDLARC